MTRYEKVLLGADVVWLVVFGVCYHFTDELIDAMWFLAGLFVWLPIIAVGVVLEILGLRVLHRNEGGVAGTLCVLIPWSAWAYHLGRTWLGH